MEVQQPADIHADADYALIRPRMDAPGIRVSNLSEI